MRLVGVLPNPELASTFGEYLQTLGIAARVDEAHQQPSIWEIWVRDEDQVARSKNELERFVANPRASEFVTTGGTAVKAEPSPEPQITRVRFNTAAATEHHPIVTLGLILMCVVVAFAIPFPTNDADEFEKFQQHSLHNQLLYEPVMLGVPPQKQPPFSAIRAGEVWRLFTPALAHVNLTHLIMNMSGLISLGLLIERRDGSLRFLLLTLFLAAVSHTAQYMMGLYREDPYPGNFIGISGVVFGFFGYAWARTLLARPLDPWHRVINPQQVYYILAFGLICMTGLFGPIANAAHFGGMFAGMLWAWLGAMYRKNAARNKVVLK